jgi:hypothetical protein
LFDESVVRKFDWWERGREETKVARSVITMAAEEASEERDMLLILLFFIIKIY